MNDTAVVTSDLDRLAERVERAATLVTDLRSKNAQLESRANQFEAQAKELEAKRAQFEAQATQLTAQNAQLQSKIDELQTQSGQLSTKTDEFEKQLSLLGQQRDALEKKLEETHSKLQGNDPTAVLGELAALKKEQREWLNERKEVAARIEAISAKLERIE